MARVQRRVKRGTAQARIAPSAAQMIITHIKESVTSPNTNETLTVSEFDTMNATSQIPAIAERTSAAIRLRSAAEDRARVPLGTCCVCAVAMRAITVYRSVGDAPDMDVHTRTRLVPTGSGLALSHNRWEAIPRSRRAADRV